MIRAVLKEKEEKTKKGKGVEVSLDKTKHIFTSTVYFLPCNANSTDFSNQAFFFCLFFFLSENLDTIHTPETNLHYTNYESLLHVFETAVDRHHDKLFVRYRIPRQQKRI